MLWSKICSIPRIRELSAICLLLHGINFTICISSGERPLSMLTYRKGKITSVYYSARTNAYRGTGVECIAIYIDSYSERLIHLDKKIANYLKKDMNIELWTYGNFYDTEIAQIKYNGEYILKHNESRGTIVFIIFIIHSVILAFLILLNILQYFYCSSSKNKIKK